MSNLREEHTRAGINCARCKEGFIANSIDHLCFDNDGNCQVCRAELSGKYADGNSTKLDVLISAARDLRKASVSYTDGSEKGEIHYADAIHESVDLLIDALYEYEKGGDK